MSGMQLVKMKAYLFFWSITLLKHWGEWVHLGSWESYMGLDTEDETSDRFLKNIVLYKLVRKFHIDLENRRWQYIDNWNLALVLIRTCDFVFKSDKLLKHFIYVAAICLFLERLYEIRV